MSNRSLRVKHTVSQRCQLYADEGNHWVWTEANVTNGHNPLTYLETPNGTNKDLSPVQTRQQTRHVTSCKNHRLLSSAAIHIVVQGILMVPNAPCMPHDLPYCTLGWFQGARYMFQSHGMCWGVIPRIHRHERSTGSPCVPENGLFEQVVFYYGFYTTKPN